MRSCLERWGLLLLVATAVFGFHRISIEPVSAHYLLFTRAAHALWHRAAAYGTDHGTGIGLWLYSPSCAMFFFGPFSLFPDRVGMLLYMAVSVALFGWGAEAVSKASGAPSRPREIFFALCAAPLLSAIVTTKLEIAMAGLILLSTALLLKKRLPWLAGFLMAIIANWKLLAAPTILLWMIALWKKREMKTFAWGVFWGVLLAYGLPYLFLPAVYLDHEGAVWRASLATFTRESLFHFENVFCFVKYAFGFETPWWLAEFVSALAGLAFAVCVWARAEVLFAAALGAAFAMAFSPLGQNNGLILIAPLLLWFTRLAFSWLGCVREQALWIGGIALTLIVPYSDLVPLPARDYLHALSIKQMLLLAAAVFGVYLELTGVAKKRQSKDSRARSSGIWIT
jgi:hypothetical protein